MNEKINGIKECVKLIREDIKTAKVRLEQAEKDYKQFGAFDDCSDFYREEYVRAKQELDTLVAMKIKLEKYWKKLRWEAKDED